MNSLATFLKIKKKMKVLLKNSLNFDDFFYDFDSCFLTHSTPTQLAQRIGEKWLDLLTLPDIVFKLDDPNEFILEHQDLLNENAQNQINYLTNFEEPHVLAIQLMALALFLGKAIGADVKSLAEMWSKVGE